MGRARRSCVPVAAPSGRFVPPVDSPSPSSVRCFDCGAAQPPSADACERCGAQFLGLCACGAQHSLFAPACPACGRAHTPRRFVRTRAPWFRVLRWGLALALVAGPAALWVFRTPKETPWGLKEAGLAHVRDGRWEDAARAFEAAIAIAPRDKLAWFNLALSRRGLGLAPEAWTPAARTCLEIDPDFPDAHVLLAIEAADRGDVETAVGHAVTASAKDPRAHRLVAEIEMRRLRPDLHRALAAVRSAMKDADAAADLRLLHAEILLRIHGLLAPSSYPPEVETALAAARDVLDDPALRDLPAAEFAMLRIRLLLATGRMDEAYATALDVLENLPPATRLSDQVALRLLEGRAAHARGRSPGGGRDAFRAALVLRPDGATVGAIVGYLVGAGDAPLAESLLADASAGTDASGVLAAGLAEVRLATGDVVGASTAAARALAARPDDPDLLFLAGRVAAHAGRLGEARTRFARATEARPGWVEPEIESALLALREVGDPAVRERAVEAAVADLERLRTQHASVGLSLALARLLQAAGRGDDAQRAAEEVTRDAPSLTEAWILLGELHAAAVRPEEAARAFGRARGLRPDDAQLALREARALLDAGDLAGVVAVGTERLLRDPAQPVFRELRADANVALERWDAALDDLSVLAQGTADGSHVHLRMIDVEIRAGRREAALRRIDALLPSAAPATRSLLESLRAQALSQDPSIWLSAERARGPSALLVALEMRAGQFAAARETARRVLDASPGDPVTTEFYVLLVCDLSGDDAAARADCRARIDALAPGAPPGLGAMLRARVLLAEGRDSEAWDEAREAARLLVRHPAAAFLLGEAACRTGRTDEGLAAFRRASVLPGAPPGFALRAAKWFARAALDTADATAAQRLAGQALRLDPTCIPAALRLAEIYAQAADFASAATVLDQVLAGAPDDAATDVRIAAAVYHAHSGNGREALDRLQRFEAAGIAAGQVALVRGWLLLDAGDADGAAAAFERAAAAGADPGSTAAGRAVVALRGGDVAGTVAAIAAWMRAHPDDVLVAQVVAARASAAGRTEAAVEVLTTAASVAPGSLPLRVALADALLAAGRPGDAAAMARAFAAARKDDPWAPALLATVLVSSPATAGEGLAVAEAALAAPGVADPVRMHLEAAAAYALLTVGRVAEAGTAATAALRTARPGTELPASVERRLRHVLGCVALAGSDYAAAAEHFERCVRLAPRDPDALNNLAWALAADGRNLGVAVESARKAAELRPDDPSVRDTLAVAEARAGNDDRAEAAWIACLSLHEAHPHAHPDGRARAALRFARHLKSLGRTDASRKVAATVLGYRPAPSEALLTEAEQLSVP